MDDMLWYLVYLYPTTYRFLSTNKREKQPHDSTTTEIEPNDDRQFLPQIRNLAKISAV